MKTIIILLLLCISITVFAQEEKFSVSINTEPNAWIKDGFNIGADIEIQQDWFYLGVGVYSFPKLNDLPYIQYHTNVGLNYRDSNDNNRLYIGGVAGFNQRDYKGAYTVFGFEGGYEHYFGSFGIGIESQYVNRQDTKFHGGKLWNYNGAIKLIYRWN